MSDYGVLPTGFNRKRLDVILQEQQENFKALFGDNFNVAPESPDGQIIGVVSESFANLWELAEAAYNAYNPSAATSAALSDLVQLNRIERLAATSSRVSVNLTGTSGTVIPVGSLVSTADSNVQFSTETEVTLDAGGNGSVFVSAVETGPSTATAGTITNIDTPIAGWDTVTNPADATVGTNEETDAQLRSRRIKSVSNSSQNIVESISAAVGNVDGVTQAVVFENDTDTTDANGVPPHSFETVVSGGTDAAIAQAIWLNKPAGIRAFGDTTVVVNDSQGLPHNIGLTRPTAVPIYIIANITTDSEFPGNGVEQMQQAVVDYAAGILVQGQSIDLGEDVYITRLFTPLNSVVGHVVVSLFIGTAPAPSGQTDIPIAQDSVASFDTANITINIL